MKQLLGIGSSVSSSTLSLVTLHNLIPEPIPPPLFCFSIFQGVWRHNPNRISAIYSAEMSAHFGVIIIRDEGTISRALSIPYVHIKCIKGGELLGEKATWLFAFCKEQNRKRCSVSIIRTRGGRCWDCSGTSSIVSSG